MQATHWDGSWGPVLDSGSGDVAAIFVCVHMCRPFVKTLFHRFVTLEGDILSWFGVDPPALSRRIRQAVLED